MNADAEKPAGWEAVEHLQEVQRAILDAFPANTALVDGEGLIVAVNQSWRDFAATHSLPDSQYGVGKNYLHICRSAVGDGSDGARAAADGILGVLQGQLSGFQCEYPCHSPTDAKWYCLSVAPLGSARAGAVILHIDITGRKMGELVAGASHAKLALAQRIARLGSWEFPLADHKVQWSDQVYRILGMTRSTLGNNFEAFMAVVHPDDRDQMAQALHMALAGEAGLDVENRVLRPDGTVRWVHQLGELERAEAGQPARLAGTLQDITERKWAEQETRRANTTLAGIVATLQEIADDHLSLAEMMDLMAARAQALTGASGGCVALLEEDELVCLAASGTAAGQVGTRLARSSGILGLALDSGIVQVRQDAHSDDRVELSRGSGPRERSMVVAPLLDGQKVVGVLKVVSPQPQAFAQHDVGNLQILVGSLGAVIQRQHAAERLRASEAQYRLLFANHPLPMWTYDIQTLRFQAVNLAAVRHYGYSEAEFLSMTLGDLQPLEDPAHPASAGVTRQRKRDGSMIDVELCSDGVLFNGRPARLVLAQDVTERLLAECELARTNRALIMLTLCNEALTQIEDETRLLQESCRIATQTGGYTMAWVGYAQDDELHSIVPVAHAGQEAGSLSEIDITWNSEKTSAMGPAGQVILSGETVICQDIEASPSFQAWHGPAHQRGYRGVICLPLKDENRTFGFLGLYSAQVLRPSLEELKLLQQLANDLAFGVRTLRARDEGKRFQAAVLKVATSVSTSTGAEFFQQLVSNVAEAVGAIAAFVARVLPGQPLAARTVAVVLDGRIQDNFEYPLEQSPCFNLSNDEEYVVLEKLTLGFPGPAFFKTVGAQAYVGRRLENAAGMHFGMLVVLYREPLKKTDFVISTLRLFAARAASELERRETEARLSEQAALLDAAHESIYVKDLQDRIVYWNKGSEKLYGWSAGEAMGQKVSQLLFQEEVKYLQAWALLLADGEWKGEMEKRSKDGRRHMVEVSWTLVRDGLDQPKSVLAINVDITDKKKLEAQFLRAQRMESIGTLAGGIAHDLNNVLAPILLSVGILKDAVESEEDRALLETLTTSARRGAELVKQVLGFARGMEGERIIVNPLPLVQELFLVMRDTFPKSIDVQVKAARLLWTVTGDPTQLHQVFLNLCVNARDAMPAGGSLTISLENVVLDDTYAAMNPDSHPGTFVMIEVADSGTGIAPDIRETIFEPFFTTKPIGKGTGLGLSTTLAIVRSHGGFIHLYSEPGRGTKFKVYLPANTAEHKADRASVVQTQLPRGHGELVLVVDDELAIRNIAKATLERFGYRVVLACHGAEAVVQYVQHQREVAAVLTDMAMPIMDGPALIIALQAINPKVRIIGSSGLTANDSLARAVGAGVKHFIPKPYSAEAMLQTLQQALQD